MRFFRFLMRGLDLQTLSCSGQIRLGHWAMAGNSCLREGLCSQLNGGFFCLWSLQELPGNMLKHSKFHWMKRPKIHIYLNKYIYIYIYIYIYSTWLFKFHFTRKWTSFSPIPRWQSNQIRSPCRRLQQLALPQLHPCLRCYLPPTKIWRCFFLNPKI